MAGIAVALWDHPFNPLRQLKPDLTAAPIILFNSTNIDPVTQRNEGPPQPTVFTNDKPHYLTHVYTYHYNAKKGAPPGIVALRRSDGAKLGPWEMGPVARSDNLPNVSWVVQPRMVIPAGSYTVENSSPATWSYNQKSGGRGFVLIQGLPLK